MSAKELLEKDLELSQIQWLSMGGRSFAYAQYPALVRRLNDVLGVGGWSVTFSNEQAGGTGFYCKCTISVFENGDLGIRKDCEFESYGAANFMGQSPDLDKTIKTAQTNAFKKAVSYLGLSLHLWEGTINGEPLRNPGRR